MKMTKTFHEILAEKDDEYTYHVKSTVDIHQPERFERIRMTLMPFQIKAIVADGYTPLSKDNKTFPNQPNHPTFSVKVVTGLPVDTKRTLETMAMMLHIHQSHLNMTPEDDVASVLPGKPVEVDKTTSQLLVGQKRIGEFMKELQSDRKEREEKFVTREVYECYFTTHRALETMMKKPYSKGYYMIEGSQEGDQHFIRTEGPFNNRPDGNIYRDRIGLKPLEIVSESDADGLRGSVILVERKVAPNVSEMMFEVGVSDMNSGRRFTSMVRAASPDIAREMAVTQVAEAHRIDPSSLTAMAPKPANSSPLMWSEAIENPGPRGTGGQGHDPDHASHPLHGTVTQHGYQYSHSTPIKRQDGSGYIHHTYQHPSNPEHKVGVSSHSSDRWDTTTSPGTGRQMTGSGAENLHKHLTLKRRRYGLR
jgi:hypothetical protein